MLLLIVGITLTIFVFAVSLQSDASIQFVIALKATADTKSYQRQTCKPSCCSYSVDNCFFVLLTGVVHSTEIVR